MVLQHSKKSKSEGEECVFDIYNWHCLFFSLLWFITWYVRSVSGGYSRWLASTEQCSCVGQGEPGEQHLVSINTYTFIFPST